MRRRGLLGSAGLVFASVVTGCLGDNDDPGEGTDGDPETGENGSSGDFERYVSVTDIDEVPEPASVEFDVQVTGGTVTADGTGSLEAGVTNTGDVERQVRTPYYKGASEGDPRSFSIRSKPRIAPRRTTLPTVSRIRPRPRSSPNGRTRVH